ncbi:MAG: YhcH/YjgK/YiaL family protein [Thermodesulfobacteriota bacterium]
MIVTDLEHITGQIHMLPGMQKAIDYLRGIRGRAPAAGKVEIDGKRVIAGIQAYETIVTDTPLLEAHRKYIDFQFMVSGEEVIAWAPLERLTITEPYDEEKENCLGTVPLKEATPVLLRAGQLAVFYPEDAHAPKLAAGKPAPVSKIVVKVAV